jgi:hypothetical protein
MTKFDAKRLFLFTHSYSGKLLAEYVVQHSKKKGTLIETDIRLLAKMLRFRHKDLKEFIINAVTYEGALVNLHPNLEIFLEVESEFERIALEQLDSLSLTKDDYHKPTLLSALERTVGDSLGDIDDDTEFQTQLEERTKQHRYLYYKVAWKYRLPTMRNVAFIVRMISL